MNYHDEIGRYSADYLLREKPIGLSEISFIEDEPGLKSIQVNGVDIFADTYEMRYGSGSVILRFYNKDLLVATISVFGSTEHKNDECLVICRDGIVSETGIRMIMGQE